MRDECEEVNAFRASRTCVPGGEVASVRRGVVVSSVEVVLESRLRESLRRNVRRGNEEIED